MNKPELHIVILAAGRGQRMRSEQPKVLQQVGGQPMLAHVLKAAQQLPYDGIHVVYGYGGEQLRRVFTDTPVAWVKQAEQLGTGHALAQAMPSIPDNAQVLVLMGDQPLITARSLQILMIAGGDLAILTMRLENPTGYGRIVRNVSGEFTAIVEHADASPMQLEIKEVNSGVYRFPAGRLKQWLARLDSQNAAGENYLTDVLAMAVAEQLWIKTSEINDPNELLGANDRVQLARLERIYQLRQAERLMVAGVALADPGRVDVRGQVQAGKDVFLDINTVLIGNNFLADEVSIGPGCILEDCRLAAGTKVLAHSVLQGVVTEGECSIGPFARLRSGTVLAAGVKIGNFVETKKAVIGTNSKASHLSYLGDAVLGANVNIGAGTITCNYDGVNKYQTTIGDGVFIGSDTQLVAPVSIGTGAFIGAGSTITQNAPADKLTLSRRKQVTIDRWQPPQRRRSED